MTFLNILFPSDKFVEANCHVSETLLILSFHILALFLLSSELLFEPPTTMPTTLTAAHLYECSLHLVMGLGGI